jgi:TP901 family phage tail tape measure protein
MDEEFKVKIGVEVDTAGLDAQIAKIKPSNKIKCDVELNDASVQHIVDQLNNGIKAFGKNGNEIKFTADVTGLKKDVASAVKGITEKSAANNIKVNADTNNAKKSLSGLTAVIEKSENGFEKLRSELAGMKFNTSSIDAFMKELENSLVTVEKVDASFTDDHTFTLNVKGLDEAEKKIQAVITAKEKLDEEGNSTGVWNTSTKVSHNLYDRAAEEKKAAAAAKQAAAKEAAAVKQAKAEEAAAAKQAAAEAKAAAQEQAAAEKQVAAAAKQAAKEQAAAAQIAANAKTQRQKLIDTYKAKKQSDVDVDSKYNKINNPSDDLIKAYDAYKNAKKNLFDTENFTDDIVAVNQYNAALETVKNQLSIVANKERDAATAAKAEASAQKEAAAAMQLRSKANNLSMSMDAWLKRNSAAAKTFGGQIRSLQAELKSCDATRFSGIQSEFKTITTQAEIIGKTGLSMGDRLKTQFTKLSSYFGAASVVMTGIQAVKEGFQNVLDVDTKLTELYRVTDFTSSQYSDVYDTLITSAQKYGATLTDLISQTADWSRAGFSDPDTAARLSEITSVYQHIADLDANTSMENLLTAYKGFEPQLKKQFGGDAAAAAEHIADVYNEIDNNYATTAADIGEAVKRSASALSLAGNSLEETAGMVTGITEVTQDPEKAGNSLKVLSMRLRGMKGELQDLGEETDENVENLSQMQGKVLNLTHGKVNIFDNVGDFKSTYEIMQGIADIYDDLTDSDKADLLETIAGKNRANEVAALIQNWDRVAQATESAENSAGSAMAEQEKYANSLQGRLNSLTSSLQTISNTALDSGFLKGLVSGATDVINAVNKIIDAIDIIPTVATAAGAAVSLSGKGMFKVITDETGKSKMQLNGWAKNIVSYFKDVSSGVVQVFGEAFNKINTELGNDNTFNFNAKKIKGANGGTGFVANLDSDLSKLKEYKDVIETLKKNQKDGQEINFDFAMDKYLSNASASAQEFAKSWDLSNDALGEFSKKQIEATGVISKTSSSMTNAKNIISAYNNLVDESGQAQSKFASAISTFNPQLGNYLYGLKSGEASLSGYGVQLATATVKTFALEAATLALNAALTFGISMLVSAGVSALMSWINRADELSDKIDDITTKYKQQKEELQSSKKTIDDVSDSYEKLSQGVNPTTNDNITLSNDEYKEYIDIVNQIADTFPTLVSGYDAQGNAILSCAGNVDKLNAAYKEMANNNYDDVLKEANNFIKDFKNKSDDLESDNGWGQFWDTVPFVSNDMRKDSYDTLKDLISDTENFDDKMSDLSFHADWDFDLDAYDKLNEIAQAFENAGIERKNFFESDGDFVKRAITENKKVAKQIVGDYEEQMKAATEDMQTATEAYFGKAFLNGKYSNISKNMQNAMNQMIPNLGYDYFSQFKNAEDMYGSLDKILTSVNDVNGKDKTFETYFDLQAKVNNGECTVGEYVNNLNDVISVIDGLDVDKNAKKALKLSLQLDDNDIKKQYTSFKNSLIGSGVDKDIAKKFADGLNAQELEAAVKLKAEGKIDFKNLNLDDFKKQIQDAAKYAKAMKFTIDMDAEIDSLDKFNTALSESKTAGGLATETIDAIKSRFKGLSSYNPAVLFEETANGIRLNTTEYQKLNKEIINNKKTEAQQTLDTLNDKYNELGESIKNCSDASKMADLLTEQENIRLQINDVAELAAQYDGLTSKYKAWQDAESAGSDRDMYESVLSGFKEVDDELSRGWLDDASKAFIDLFSNGELKSIDDYTNRWKTLGDTIQGTTYSAKDFFTQDDDGNSTNDGVYNFLEAADQLGMGNIQRDGNGEIISFDFGVNGEKAVADAMGISEELVQIIERASEDAGFTINMDGARTQYADMANAAQDAADAILKAKQENSDLLKDFSTEDLSFNFEETTLDGVKGQLDKAKTLLDSFKQDGKLNLDSTEAQNALQVVQTLQAQWDQLNKPAYMSIDTTQVDKSLQEPIKKMQEFDNLSTQKNQMVLAGVDTSDIDKQMDDIVNELEELDPEIKAQLGIDGKTPDELKQDLENDDIRMKGELDIQAKMSGDLSILSDKALLDAGIIDEKEFKRRVSVETEVDADVDTSKAESETEEKTESFFDKAKKKIDEAGKTIGEKFGEAKEAVSNGIDSAKQGIEDACKSFEESPIDQTLSKIGDSLGAATSKVGDSFSGVVDKVSKPFKKIMGTIGEGVEGFASDKWSEFTDWLSSVGDGISQFADDASKFGSGIGDGLSDFINSIGDWASNSEVNVTGKSSVEDISSALGELDDKQIEVTADVIGKIDVEQLQSAMCDLDDKSVEAIAKAIGEGDVQGLKSAMQNIPDKKVAQAIAKAFGYNDVDALCGAIDGLNPKVVEAIAKAFGISDVESLDDVVSGLDDNTVNAIAKAIGEGDVNALQSIINNMHGNSVDAEANTSGQPEKVGFLQSIINALTGNSVSVDADTSSGQSAVSGFQSMIDGLHGTTVTITATIAKAASDLWGMITGGGGVVDGTAHSSGTAHASGTAFVKGTTGRAFKQGNWGTKENGVALGGELGTELLVRDGRWYTIGEDSAEFFGYKKGDIIFNADQTREIFEKGKITHGNGRGKALASGTAFGRGSGGIGHANNGSSAKIRSSSSGSKSSSSSSSNSNSNSSANKEAEKTEETLDWIETALDRVERAISKLDKTATSTYKNWTKRGTALNDQISQTRREIDLQNQAYNRYIQQANSVGLDAGYAAKVRDGTIDIEKITDEDLNNKISEYKQWYEKALDCLDAIDDLRESESKLYEQRFENVSTKYDGYLGVIQHEKDMLDEFVSQTETAGYITSGKYYDAMSANAKKQQEELKKQRDEMISELNNAVNSGTIEKYGESWYNMVNSIDDVTKSIEECNTSLLEYQKNLRELDWQIFDLVQDKISKVADESEFLINLMSNKKLYEDNGQLTDEGMASMGQYGVKYNVYMAQADKYAKKIKELQADLAKDPYNQDIANQLQEYIEAQQEAILNAEDMKNSIKDMVSDGIDKELDSLQKLIDKRNDALDAAKDLYDYQKKIKESTKDIADLEKQMAAYQGDVSEETKAKIQQIKVDLEEAKSDLEETEYEQYISDQQKMLDDLYTDYETILNQRLDDIDALMADMISEINNNASTIGATIESQADKVGYTLSESMNTIWLSGNGSISNVITTYGTKFDTALTTTNTALGYINTNIQNMIAQLNKIAGTKIKAAGASAATEKPTPKPSSTPTQQQQQQQQKKQITVGGTINAGGARIYADSYGNGGGRQTFGSDPIYTVLQERNGYILTRWHKLSSGYTGWFKKSDVSAYALGAKNIRNNEMAWTQEDGSEMIMRPSDGAILTPLAKNDSVLASAASSNIWNMANNPSDFIKDNLNFDKIDTGANVGNKTTYTQNLDKVVFNLPNVKNYNELLKSMQHDKNFERLIMAMTIDPLAGKSSLAKGKAIR